jgi:rubrerythrin
MAEYTAELYVHAIAIESEAAARYAQLARAMADQGNVEAGAVFALLAAAESRHLDVLQHRAHGLTLPRLDADYTWREREAPETVTLDRRGAPVTPLRALALALDAELRARAFFEQAARVCGDEETRALALEMAAEEAEHAVLIEGMIARAQLRSGITQ